jgi:hypothetical protein
VAALLEAEDLELAMQGLRELPRQRVLRALLASLCTEAETRKWRAVSTMGMLVADLARENTEEARELMRRLMWSLNDESGSSGWGTPEAMAEIMAAHEGLAEEYVHMLVSYMREDGNYLENPLLQRGLLWGIGRLAEARPVLVQKHDAAAYLMPFLDSNDQVVQGLAAWCAGILEVQEARSELESLVDEETEIPLYKDLVLRRFRTGQLAKEALERLDKRSC